MSATSSPRISVSGRARDPRRDLVERIIASPTFTKSARLSSFLVYVCDLALQGREEEINEQSIGVAVFGRPPGYDPAVDGIVRTHGSRLRQRLEMYFQEEGAGEPIRLMVPRGGYIPVFEPRTVTPIPLAGLETAESLGEDPSWTPPLSASSPDKNAVVVWKRATIGCAAVALILLIAVALVLGPHSELAAGKSTNPLWSRLFFKDQPVMLVPGDSGLVMLQGLTDHSVSLAEYLAGEYRTQPPASQSADRKTVLDLGGRRYTSIVDLDLATQLWSIAHAARSKMQIRYARDLRPNDLKQQGTVILVGAQEANPWVELFEHNMNFVLDDNRETRIFSVLNRAPQGNEPARWESDFNDPQHIVYGVVAFLPNLSGNGNVLILEGTSMPGTESAGDFVFDDSAVLPFLKKISSRDGTLPYFELLVRTSNMGGSAAKSTIQAYRIVKN